MERLTNLIKEVLSTPPKKKDCNCGCGGCSKPTPKGIALNESIAPKQILSENLRYHVQNKLPLTENTFRYGSKSFINLWAEARALYLREIIDVNNDDKEILLETDLGNYGIYEGVRVPLDMPLSVRANEVPLMKILQRAEEKGHTKYPFYRELADEFKQESIDLNRVKEVLRDYGVYFEYEDLLNLNEIDLGSSMLYEGIKMKLKDLTFDKVKELFPDRYKKPKNEEGDPSDKYYSYYDSINFPNPDDSLTTVEHSNMLDYWKETTFEKYGNVDIELNPDEVWFNKVKILDDEFEKDKLSYTKRKQAWLDNERAKGRTSGLDENKKKKNPPLNKPKRGGSKAYYVYVKDPKTKKIKKVSFGSGGLKAKINNPKARQAFAKRHRCSEKTDKTKASYWSCRLPRYAKLLGLKSSFSGFW